MHLLAYILAFPILVLAQTSPFGTLTDERMQNRKVFETRGQRVSDYLDRLGEYRSLTTESQGAFGDRRTELQEMSLDRAKDVLLSKLGAVETHIQKLIDRTSGTDKEVLIGELQDLQSYINGAKIEIEAATTLAELRAISVEINTELAGKFGVGNYYALKIWIQRGLGHIEMLMDKADLVQSHIDGAAELGGDVSGIQAMFDSAMLALENAKGVYEDAMSVLSGLSASDPGTLVQLQRVRATNAEVVQAHSDLKQVIRELRALYGQSPWTIDLKEEN